MVIIETSGKAGRRKLKSHIIPPSWQTFSLSCAFYRYLKKKEPNWMYCFISCFCPLNLTMCVFLCPSKWHHFVDYGPQFIKGSRAKRLKVWALVWLPELKCWLSDLGQITEFLWAPASLSVKQRASSQQVPRRKWSLPTVFCTICITT